MELDTRPGRGARKTTQRRRGRGPWVRLVIAGGAALALSAASLALTSPAQGIDATGTGALDARGFPTHYTDDSGISLKICEDGSANCLGATTADLADTTDGEAFYWMATASIPSSRGTLDVEFALEAAFSAPNVPMVFDRLRVRGDLTRAGTYTLQHPYGSTRVEAANPAQPRNVNFTDDIVCTLNAGCAGRIDSFLRAVPSPVGYIGGGDTLSRVAGGTVRNELVLRAPNGDVIGRTARFAILGQVADGPAAALSADSVDFGNSRTAVRRSVAVRNLGLAPLALQNISVTGARSITVANSGCAARASLASGATCQINLTYRPGARNVSTGTLVVNDDTIASVHRLPVRAMTASVFSARRNVSFRRTPVREETRARRIVVENTGVVPMRIRSVQLSNERNFDRRTGQGPLCARGLSVRPGAACAIYVAFTPKTFGPKTATVTVRSNAANDPGVINLSGRGR